MTTALITGASAGIGRAFAHELARSGHHVILVARNELALNEVAKELTATYGVSTEVMAADLGVRNQVEVVAQRLRDPERPVDLLVNNAGFGLAQDFITGDISAEENMLDVLCTAVLVLSHAAGGAMAQRGRGAIINVSSVAGFVALGTYSACKAWVTSFSVGLHHALRGSGVRVTAVCPGFTRTQFHQRAGIDAAGLPAFAWLQDTRVVKDALNAVRAGRPVCVPARRYQALVRAISVAPIAAAALGGGQPRALARSRSKRQPSR